MYRVTHRVFAKQALEEALKHIEPTKQAYVSLLRECGKNLNSLRAIHQHMSNNTHFFMDRFVKNILIEMYGKCGSVYEARIVFESIRCDRCGANVYSWTLLIAAYAQNGYMQTAVEFFQRMELDGVKPDAPTLVIVSGLFGALGQTQRARQLHTRIQEEDKIRSDIVLATAILDMHAKLGCVCEAREVFDQIRYLGETVSWTAMASTYLQSGDSLEAFNLYRNMALEGVKPNAVTFLVIFGVNFNKLAELRNLEEQAGDMATDSIIGSAIVTAYGKLNSVEDAKRAFKRVKRQSTSSFNSMIVVYVKCGYANEAVELYKQMNPQDVDEITYSCVLSACSRVSFQQGKHVIVDILSRSGMGDSSRSAAIQLYATYGDLKAARSVFESELFERHISCWNALIGAYAQHGNCLQVVELVYRMCIEGVVPDDTTFMSVLFACSHAGRLQSGVDLFRSMQMNHGITPNPEHCRCMVDLMGRAGRLESAECIIMNMVFKPGDLEWNILLGAFKMLIT